MSGLLESESESDTGTEENSFLGGILSTDDNLRSSKSKVIEYSSLNTVENKLEQYSRRLSQLGLDVDTTNDSVAGDEIEISSEDRKETKALVEGQEIPTSASLYLGAIGESLKKRLNNSAVSDSKDENDISDVPSPKFSEVSIENKKIQIRFQPIGSVPPLNPSTYTVSAEQPFATIVLFIKRRLKMKDVYCYVNNSFAPNPQQIINDLWKQYNIGNELIINYCATVAFG